MKLAVKHALLMTMFVVAFIFVGTLNSNAEGIITTVAGNGIAGFSGDGVAATDALLKSPLGVFVDSSGSIFIADSSNHRIRSHSFPESKTL
ncbi:MAG: hypothetical protein ACUZ8O_15940 [Candidatus Anammoxibacter sp.]